MKRTAKKKENLNNLNTGCSPCLKEAAKIEGKIGDRDVSEIKLEEIKKIISSLFDEKIKR